jgi:hypothetical protein
MITMLIEANCEKESDPVTGDAALIGDTVLVEENGCRLLTDTPLGYGLEDTRWKATASR